MIVAASLVTNIFSRWLMTILFMPFGPNAEDIVSENSLQASKKAKEIKIEYQSARLLIIHVELGKTKNVYKK